MQIVSYIRRDIHMRICLLANTLARARCLLREFHEANPSSELLPHLGILRLADGTTIKAISFSCPAYEIKAWKYDQVICDKYSLGFIPGELEDALYQSMVPSAIPVEFSWIIIDD